MTDYKNDIEKYLKGELTPSQMHALEKRALDDPFLADALEGAQHLTPEEMAVDFNLLQGALQKRLSKKANSPWVWPMRVAAGLLILAVSTYLIISFNNRDVDKLALNAENKNIPAPAKGDSHPLVSDSAVAKDDSRLSSQPSEKREGKEMNVKSKKPGPQAEQGPTETEKSVRPVEEKPAVQDLAETDDVVKGEAAEERDEQRIAATTPAEAPSTIRLDAKEKEIADADEPTRQKSAAGAANTKAFTDKASRRVIHGKVTFADDGAGLPGVNVIVKGSNQGTVTDAQGNYMLTVEDIDPSLTFSFIGFNSKEVAAKSDELNVQLDTDVSELNEIVVVGYSAPGDVIKTKEPPIVELASPAGGRKYFKQYLEENLQYPQQALANQVEGKVTIQFSIGTTGQLSDFRVIRGLGFGCEEEVIRLIKEGPKWSPTKKDEEPVRDRVKVRMKFSLPKK